MFSSPVATAEFSKFAGIQKDLNTPDNHDSVIAHLETDSLKGEVKWALGSISTSKASGGDGISVELF